MFLNALDVIAHLTEPRNMTIIIQRVCFYDIVWKGLGFQVMKRTSAAKYKKKIWNETIQNWNVWVCKPVKNRFNVKQTCKFVLDKKNFLHTNSLPKNRKTNKENFKQLQFITSFWWWHLPFSCKHSMFSHTVEAYSKSRGRLNKYYPLLEWGTPTKSTTDCWLEKRWTQTIQRGISLTRHGDSESLIHIFEGLPHVEFSHVVCISLNFFRNAATTPHQYKVCVHTHNE